VSAVYRNIIKTLCIRLLSSARECIAACQGAKIAACAHSTPCKV